MYIIKIFPKVLRDEGVDQKLAPLYQNDSHSSAFCDHQSALFGNL